MKEVERRGVLIDLCPECKGVWLDKGELGKLLAASREYEPEVSRLEKQEHRQPSYNYHEREYRDKKQTNANHFSKTFLISLTSFSHPALIKGGEHGDSGPRQRDRF
ncbi:MAG: TFIIB-type zinc ribbon-containing protein [Desulfotomaculales bacterium]